MKYYRVEFIFRILELSSLSYGGNNIDKLFSNLWIRTWIITTKNKNHENNILLSKI